MAAQFPHDYNVAKFPFRYGLPEGYVTYTRGQLLTREQVDLIHTALSAEDLRSSLLSLCPLGRYLAYDVCIGYNMDIPNIQQILENIELSAEGNQNPSEVLPPTPTWLKAYERMRRSPEERTLFLVTGLAYIDPITVKTIGV